MKVMKWVNWGECNRPVANIRSENREYYVEALRKEGKAITGNEHQHGENGMPILDNGEAISLSMRSWGSLMADAFGGDYMDYYM